MKIIGVCRFSFLGLGDWTAYRETSKPVESIIEATAHELFQGNRLSFRLKTFESLCLRSIVAQRNQDFEFVVLTAKRLPQVVVAQLQKICAPHKNVHIHAADVMPTVDAVEDAITTIFGSSIPHLQFRIDDDDCLFVNYTKEIAWVSEKLSDIDSFAVSFTKTLVAEADASGTLSFALREQPFLSAGAAVKIGGKTRSVYSFGHHKLKHRLPYFVDNRPISAVMLHHKGNDQPRPSNIGLTRKAARLSDARIKNILKRDFPYLQKDDLGGLLALSLASH